MARTTLLEHAENDEGEACSAHWRAWCKVVEEDGYTEVLKLVAMRLRVLDSMSVEEI